VLVSRYKYLYSQREWAAYDMPAEHVAFDGYDGEWNGPSKPACDMPAFITKLLPSSGKLHAQFGPPGIVFAHRLRNPSGQERLVVVWASVGESRMRALLPPNGDNDAPTLEADTYIPAMTTGALLGKRLTQVPNPAEDLPDGRLTWTQLPENFHARIYAGQLDPADESHFTIDFELHVGSRYDEPQIKINGVVDGWLVADNDVAGPVHLTIRKHTPFRIPEGALLSDHWWH
jgi:hypothetical protein